MIHQDYRTGRGVAKFLAFLGWFQVVFGGFVFTMAFLFMMSGRFSGQGSGLIGFVLGQMGIGWSLFVVVTGLLIVAFSQHTRATLDSADFARQTLELARAAANESRERELFGEDHGAGRQQRSESKRPAGKLDQNPETWPEAVEEWQHRGRRALTLEDDTLAVETARGWRRFNSLEEVDEMLGYTR
jgi:hypothetical protein